MRQLAKYRGYRRYLVPSPLPIRWVDTVLSHLGRAEPEYESTVIP